MTSVTWKYFSSPSQNFIYSFVLFNTVYVINLWNLLIVWCCEVRYLKKLNFFSPALWNVHGVLYMLSGFGSESLVLGFERVELNQVLFSFLGVCLNPQPAEFLKVCRIGSQYSILN